MNQPDIFKAATRKWSILAPAIVRHCTSLTGKMGDSIKTIQADYKGKIEYLMESMNVLCLFFFVQTKMTITFPLECFCNCLLRRTRPNQASNR